MLRFLLLALLALPALAMADRIVTIPTATKIPARGIKGEYLTYPAQEAHRIWFGYGVDPLIDVEINFESIGSRGYATTFNAGYYYLLPITDIAPGIAVGIQDALNQTEDGRAIYLAVTYRFGNDGELNQDIPTEVSFGGWSRDGGKVFVGATLPLASQLRLFAEHNSIRAAAGFEVRPFENAAFRVIFESRATGFSFSYSRRF